MYCYTSIINRNADFMRLYKKGLKIFSDYCVIYFTPTGRPFNRIGITVSKKIGNAVCRNRAKRVLRQAYRDAELLFPIGVDMVIVAREAAVHSSEVPIGDFFAKKAAPMISSKISARDKKDKVEK